MIGQTLSHFQITAKLGEGGMGEVYRAEDTKLGREVAIKVLPEAVAADPERLARFDREAKVLASLNHPHIAAIYAIESATPSGQPEARLAPQEEGKATLGKPPAGSKTGEASLGEAQDDLEAPVGAVQDEGESPRVQAQPTPAERGDSPLRPIHFLVMELAEGEDLAERLAEGAIPIDEALPIALQIADALEAAHEKGIIHRDLKPANIKVDSEGNVKVLDFGLAKALDPTTGTDESGASSAGKSPSVIPLSMSPTLTAQMTGAGVILGTASYMSPEQAKGKAADKRADIWSFGVVLYEMLVGKKLFEAESVAETLGAIFQQNIDRDELPPDTPRRLRRLLGRCLERDPKLRLRDIGEARIALNAIAAGDAEPEAQKADSDSRKGRLSPLLLAAALLAVAAGATWFGTRISSAPEDPAREVTEFSIAIETADLDKGDFGTVRLMDLSPDGRRLLWSDGSKVFVRDLDNRQPRQVLDEKGLRNVFWSPDGTELAVDMNKQLWRVDVANGNRELICDLPELPKVPNSMTLDGVWRPDGSILFAAWRGGIYRVAARGGVPELLIPIDPEIDVDFHKIVLLPGGDSLALAAHYQDELIEDRDSNIGFELYHEGRRTAAETSENLKALIPLRYAQGRLVVGTRVEEKSDVWALQFDAGSGDISFEEPELLISGVDYAAVATDGTVAYLPQIEVPEVVVLVNSQGEELERFGEPQPHLSFPTLSPDGTRLAVVIKDSELWVHDIERSTATRLARDDAGVVDPQWTPDSRTLYYSAGNTSKLRRIRADPGAEIDTVHEDAFRSFLAPDGSGVLINQGGFQLEKAGGLHWFPLDGEGKLGEGRQILSGFDILGRLSPDGRMIAYRVRAEDQEETYLATFPEADQKIQLSSGGGFTPRWSRDSEMVYYFSRGRLIQVDVGLDDAGRLRASPEVPLFDLDEAGLSWHWGSTSEGFLFVKPLETDEPQEIVVRQHALARRGD